MVKRKDLTDVGDDDYEQRQSEYMLCQKCGEIIGGTRGDYFQVSYDHIFTCPNCKSDDIAIVEDIVTQEIIVL